MKAFFWQWTLITTLCLAAQCIASPFDNSKYLQEKYFSPKRTKPSLSIVNPLDVLRQRVMLEMARRQRESANKQAEINKEILKTIGKRGNAIDYNDFDIPQWMRNKYYDTARPYASAFHPKDSQPDTDSRGAKAAHDKPGQSTKPSEKSENEPSQEQVYIIDDSNTAFNDDDDDSQLKYLYSLYKNRLSNNF